MLLHPPIYAPVQIPETGWEAAERRRPRDEHAAPSEGATVTARNDRFGAAVGEHWGVRVPERPVFRDMTDSSQPAIQDPTRGIIDFLAELASKCHFWSTPQETACFHPNVFLFGTSRNPGFQKTGMLRALLPCFSVGYPAQNARNSRFHSEKWYTAGTLTVTTFLDGFQKFVHLGPDMP